MSTLLTFVPPIWKIMTSCQCEGIEREFDAKFARKELKRYRKKGLRKTSRVLVDAISARMNGAESLIDVGGGVGGIQLALLDRGLRHATSVDASSAFVAVAREEAAARRLEDRIEHRHGDVLDLADSLADADVVTLDRVVCCYHDMPRLVGTTAARARALYGLVYPRDQWWTRLGGKATNLCMRVRRSPMRTFIHPTEEVDAILREHGFRPAFSEETVIWQVTVYRRQARPD